MSLTTNNLQIPSVIPAIPAIAGIIIQSNLQDPHIGKIVNGIGLMTTGISLIAESKPFKVIKSWCETGSPESSSKKAFLLGLTGVGVAALCQGMLSALCGAKGLYPDPDIVVKAPLTIIRSSRTDIDLDISVVFNNQFSPTQPTYPLPSAIIRNEIRSPLSTHTWKVHVNPDQTLSVKDLYGVMHKINMIWWEAVRHSAQKSVIIQDSVCIKKDEIDAFIAAVLTKRGVAIEEQKAFISYWKETFKNNPEPFLQVRLAEMNELASLLPEMQVSSEAGAFDLKRFYFQFVPVEKPLSTISRNDYIDNIKAEKLSADVVIDLGGDIVNCDGIPGSSTNTPDFNNRFMDHYIKA